MMMMIKRTLAKIICWIQSSKYGCDDGRVRIMRQRTAVQYSTMKMLQYVRIGGCTKLGLEY